MRNKLLGWRTVYSFTVAQTFKGAAYKLVTALVAIVIIAAIALAIIIPAKPDEAKPLEPSPINKVYILDHSGLQPIDYRQAFSHGEEQYRHIEFEAVSGLSRKEVVQTAGLDSPETVAVIISVNETGYQLEAAIPHNSVIRSGHAQQLAETMHPIFRSGLLMQAGLTEQQLSSALKPTVTSFYEIGEDSNRAVEAVKLIVPMVFGFMLYFMLVIYSHSVSKEVAVEKTSKLIETLLVSARPYALISGKVLAITSLALFQFVIWIMAVFAGLYGGNAVARTMYPGYENSVITILNLLRNNIGETALTFNSVLLAIVFFCVGFLFYCVIAAFTGCLVSKPEDVPSTQALYTFPIIIFWLISFLTPLWGNEVVLTYIRYIPLTSPFSVPADLLTGAIGLTEGIISLLILAALSLIIIILAARIYKGLVLYTGQKLSFRTIANVLKARS